MKITNVGIDFSSIHNNFYYITGVCIIYYEDSTYVTIRPFVYDKTESEVCISFLTKDGLSKEDIVYVEQLLLENLKINYKENLDFQELMTKAIIENDLNKVSRIWYAINDLVFNNWTEQDIDTLSADVNNILNEEE